MSRRKSMKLSTPAEIRRAISRVTNMILNEEIDAKRANTILYACNIALGAIRTDEQEKKLLELQTLLEQMEKNVKGGAGT